MSTETNPFRKGEKVTGAQRAKLAASLAARYRKGAAIRLLADDLGRSYGFVHRLLLEAGVELRARGGRQGGWTHGRRPAG